MTEEYEDPQKAALRQRATVAADTAGLNVDPDRTVVPYPAGSSLKGAIRADVVASGAGGMTLYFVRVDGAKPLPQWLANHVDASFALDQTELYVVVEEAGEQLRLTCEVAGAGLLMLRSDDTFEKVLEYKPPDATAARKAFQSRLKESRTRLDTKLRLNQGRLEESFNDSAAVTATMAPKTRETYLRAIEEAMVTWRSWGEEMSERLDGLAGSEDTNALDEFEAELANEPAV